MISSMFVYHENAHVTYVHSREAFKDHQPYDSRRQPPWLIHPENSSEKPDVIMNYKT